MSFISGGRPTALPSTASLRSGRIFTTVILAFVLGGTGLALFDLEGSGGLALGLFAVATVGYSAIALLMFWQGDYILRMFGCAWPIVLAKVDELQRTQRQRAFAFTFIVALTGFTVLCGMHVGAMLAQWQDGGTPTGILPTDPVKNAALLAATFFTLTLAPQAYLAWTLIPLDAEDEE